MKFAVLSNGWAPLSTVASQACCLYLKDFTVGRPLGFPDKDIFPIVYSYDWDAQQTVEFKKHRAVQQLSTFDYTSCKNPLFWRQLTVKEKTHRVVVEQVEKRSKDKSSGDEDDVKKSKSVKKGRARTKKTPVSKPKRAGPKSKTHPSDALNVCNNVTTGSVYKPNNWPFDSDEKQVQDTVGESSNKDDDDNCDF